LAGNLTLAAATLAILAPAVVIMFEALSFWAAIKLAFDRELNVQLNEKIDQLENDEAGVLRWLESQTQEGENRNQLAFRTNKEVCDWAVEELKQEEPNTLHILQELEKANAKQMMNDLILFTIGLIGVAGGILLFCSPASIAIPILFIIIGALFLTVDGPSINPLNRMIGDFIFDKADLTRKIKEVAEPLIRKIEPFITESRLREAYLRLTREHNFSAVV
jgi:hypothetical protein